MLHIYYGSVGGNATFLLNIPPDTRGLVHENDLQRLQELGDAIRNTFETNLAADADVTASETRAGLEARFVVDGSKDTYWSPEESTEYAVIELDLGRAIDFNHIVLAEYRYGQRIERFELEYMENGNWHTIQSGTVIGRKRICRFPAVRAQ